MGESARARAVHFSLCSAPPFSPPERLSTRGSCRVHCCCLCRRRARARMNGDLSRRWERGLQPAGPSFSRQDADLKGERDRERGCGRCGGCRTRINTYSRDFITDDGTYDARIRSRARARNIDEERNRSIRERVDSRGTIVGGGGVDSRSLTQQKYLAERLTRGEIRPANPRREMNRRLIACKVALNETMWNFSAAADAHDRSRIIIDEAGHWHAARAGLMLRMLFHFACGSRCVNRACRRSLLLTVPSTVHCSAVFGESNLVTFRS